MCIRDRGGGWLAELGFSDFAGSTLVHSTGGAAALAGAMIIGTRLGRFTKSGSQAPLKPFAASSIFSENNSFVP